MFQSVMIKNLEGSGVGGAEKEEEVGGDAAGRREPRGGAGREGGSTVNNRSTGTISHGNDFSLSNKDCFVSWELSTEQCLAAAEEKDPQGKAGVWCSTASLSPQAVMSLNPGKAGFSPLQGGDLRGYRCLGDATGVTLPSEPLPGRFNLLEILPSLLETRNKTQVTWDIKNPEATARGEKVVRRDGLLTAGPSSLAPRFLSRWSLTMVLSPSAFLQNEEQCSHEKCHWKACHEDQGHCHSVSVAPMAALISAVKGALHLIREEVWCPRKAVNGFLERSLTHSAMGSPL